MKFAHINIQLRKTCSSVVSLWRRTGNKEEFYLFRLKFQLQLDDKLNRSIQFDDILSLYRSIRKCELSTKRR